MDAKQGQSTENQQVSTSLDHNVLDVPLQGGRQLTQNYQQVLLDAPPPFDTDGAQVSAYGS